MSQEIYQADKTETKRNLTLFPNLKHLAFSAFSTVLLLSAAAFWIMTLLSHAAWAQKGSAELRVANPSSLSGQTAEVTQLQVTFSQIEFGQAGPAQKDSQTTETCPLEPLSEKKNGPIPKPSKWVKIKLQNRIVDLAELEKNRSTRTVGLDYLPVGKYTHIRIFIQKATIVTPDGQKILAQVPREAVTVVNQFAVAREQKTVITINFQGSEALEKQGRRYILAPAISVGSFTTPI